MRRLAVHLAETQSPPSPRSANDAAAEASALRDELAAALRTIGDQDVTLRSLAAAASSASVTPSKQQPRASHTPGTA